MKYYFFVLLTLIMLLTSCNSSSIGSIQITSPEVNSLKDGVYRGNYSLKGTPVKVTLDVTVENQSITEIDIIKHVCSSKGIKAEQIIEAVLERQSLNVDAISGATGSSIAILKAIENALE